MMQGGDSRVLERRGPGCRRCRRICHPEVATTGTTAWRLRHWGRRGGVRKRRGLTARSNESDPDPSYASGADGWTAYIHA